MRIKNKVNKKKVEASVIIIKGINMLISILGADNLEIVAGWCKVFHQSTENLIIGIFINPIMPKAAAIFDAISLFETDFHKRI